MPRNLLESHRKLCLAGLLFLIAMILYSPTLFNTFVYDDSAVILDNPWIKSFDYISDIFSSNEWGFMKRHSYYYRPTFHLLLMAEYRLFGTAPWGFHLTSAFLHAINTILVFMVASALFPKREKRAVCAGYIYITPFLGALIFAVHTVNSAVVNWVSAISDLLYTLFYLAAFYLYITLGKKEDTFFRKPAFYLSLLLFFLAILSKETAATFLIFIIAYDLSTGSGVFKRKSLVYIPYFLITVLYLIMRNHAMGGFLELEDSGITLFEAIINVFPLILAYMSKLLVPVNLSVVYTYTPVLSLTEPRTLVAILVSLALLTAAIFLRGKKTALFSFIWIFIPLVTVLYFPVLHGGFSERYLYLSSAGFAILCAYIIETAINSTTISQNKRAALTIAAAAVVTAALALYVYGTIKRTYVWRDRRSLWSDAVKKSPENATAHNELGRAYRDMGNRKEAIYHFREAIRITPLDDKPRNNIGNVLTQMGLYDEAMAQYRAALEINPSKPHALINIGINYAMQNRFKEAVDTFQKYIEINPNNSIAFYNYAMALERLGRIIEATERYKEAVRIAPDNADAHESLANIYMREGLYVEASNEFKALLRIEPQNKKAVVGLKEALRLLKGDKGNRNGQQGPI